MLVSLVMLFSMIVSMPTVCSAADPTTTIYVDSTGSDSNDGLTPETAKLTIQAAINAASVGDRVYITTGTYELAATINVNTANITISGAGNDLTRIIAPLSGYAFKISATGITLQGIQLEKTNKVNQNLIYIGANNSTISNNIIFGKYVLGDADVSRALEIATGLTGINIERNTIYSLRQPAYINPEVVANIKNNYVYGTKGWVVDGANITFTGNTWGTGSNANYIDIALLKRAITGYNTLYSDISALSDINNNAVIEDQRGNTPLLSDVYINSSALTGGDGTKGSPYPSITSGIARSAVGGTINVSAGLYKEDVNVNKKVTIIGAGAINTTIVATNASSTPLSINTNDSTIKGFTITHDYTATELDAWTFNNNGVIFNQNSSGNTLSDCVVSLNRNGIYLNNSQNNKIINNSITNNRTGINMTNTINGTQIIGNTISNNWTIGLVFYSLGSATNLSTVQVAGNTFDQNWYSEILVKDASNGSGTLDVSNNIFSDSPITYSTSSDPSLNEPGFAGQKPNVPSIGGTETKPVIDSPTLRIYNSGSVILEYNEDIANKTVDEGNPLTFTTIGMYPGGDAQNYSVTGLPQGAIFNKTTGAFVWTPGYTQAGIYIVDFEVNDGGFKSSEEITITVNNVTPEQLLTELTEYIKGLKLQGGIENSLISTLDNAKKSLSSDKKAGINQLYAFINKVEAIRGGKLTEQQAKTIIEMTKAIIQVKSLG